MLNIWWLLAIALKNMSNSSEVWQSESFWVMVGSSATVATLLFISWQYKDSLKNEADLRFQESKPFILVSYALSEDEEILIEVRNDGRLPAFDIRFEVSDEPESYSGNLLSKAPIIRDGISILPPGEALSFAGNFHGNSFPLPAKISATYNTFRLTEIEECQTGFYPLNADFLKRRMAEEYISTYLSLGHEVPAAQGQKLKEAIDELRSQGVDMSTLEGWRKYSNI